MMLALGLVLADAAPAGADDRSDAVKQGLALVRAGKPDRALPFLTRALDLAEAEDGPDAPTTAVDLNNLAEANRQAHHYDAAENLYKRAIAIDERPAGDKIGLATSLNNLALVYRFQNRFAEAEPLYLRSLALLEQALGPNDPDLAKALNNLAVLYRARGEPEKARPLQERAVAIAEKSLGARHAVTQTMKRNLAALGGGAGRPAGVTATTPIFVPRPSRAVPTPPATPAPARVTKAAPPTASGKTVVRASSAVGEVRLHLGSVRSPDEITDEWNRLVRRHAQLAGLDLLPPQRIEVAGKGMFWRVIVGSFPDPAAAERVCREVRDGGDSCRVLDVR